MSDSEYKQCYIIVDTRNPEYFVRISEKLYDIEAAEKELQYLKNIGYLNAEISTVLEIV